MQKKLIESLNWRYATKFFDSSKKLSLDQLEILKDSLILTASSFGLQPYKFLIIENLEIRKKLTKFSWNQPQIEDCSHLVVFLAKNSINQEYLDNFIKLTAETRNMPLENLDLYKEVMSNSMLNKDKNIKEWAARQAYIALGNLMTSTALIGVDTCALEGIDAKDYDRILEIDSGYETVCACALGFRGKEDKYQALAKVRYSAEDLIEER